MRILDIVENKSILIEKDMVLKNDIFDLISDTRGKSFYSIAYKPKGLEVIAGNYIGVIPINENLALNIQPKIGVKNFFYLLNTANRDLKVLSGFSRIYDQTDDSINLIDVFTESFLHSMEIVEQEGIYKDYVRKVDNSSTPKGKLLFKENMSRNIFKNTHFKVVHAYQELDRDILPNQVIKFTIEYLIQYYRLFGRERKQRRILKRLSYYRDMFSRVSYISKIREMSRSEVRKLIKSIPQIRFYYVNTLDICFLIIMKASFHFESRETEVTKELPSIYINMEDVFEQFLLNSLNDRCIGEPIKFYKGKKKLFDNINNSPSTIEPDILVEVDNKIQCIADAKYKEEKPTREDVFQMISYLESYRCNVGVFILPKNSNKKVEYMGQINDKSLYIYRIDLSHEDIAYLQHEEDGLFNFLRMSNVGKRCLWEGSNFGASMIGN